MPALLARRPGRSRGEVGRAPKKSPRRESEESSLFVRPFFSKEREVYILHTLHTFHPFLPFFRLLLCESKARSVEDYGLGNVSVPLPGALRQKFRVHGARPRD